MIALVYLYWVAVLGGLVVRHRRQTQRRHRGGPIARRRWMTSPISGRSQFEGSLVHGSGCIWINMRKIILLGRFTQSAGPEKARSAFRLRQDKMRYLCIEACAMSVGRAKDEDASDRARDTSYQPFGGNRSHRVSRSPIDADHSLLRQGPDLTSSWALRGPKSRAAASDIGRVDPSVCACLARPRAKRATYTRPCA
jgi:hypothetical protein